MGVPLWAQLMTSSVCTRSGWVSVYVCVCVYIANIHISNTYNRYTYTSTFWWVFSQHFSSGLFHSHSCTTQCASSMIPGDGNERFKTCPRLQGAHGPVMETLMKTSISPQGFSVACFSTAPSQPTGPAPRRPARPGAPGPGKGVRRRAAR